MRYWNNAAERVFGFRVTEALGVSMNLIIPERLRPRHWAGWWAAMKTGTTRYDEGQLLAVPTLHKDGRQTSSNSPSSSSRMPTVRSGGWWRSSAT